MALTIKNKLPVGSLIELGLLLSLFAACLFLPTVVEAATLSISPSTGVYQSNNTFSAKVIVNTDGSPINAAEGTLNFNPRELSVVSVNRSGSIFNLWVTEPVFSNSAGTINFSGGLPSGYTGSAGNIMTVTFRSVGAGTTKVNFKSGSVLANDGRGTNVLSAMNGGTYTIQAASLDPEPEIIEYIPPPNTPAAPNVSSISHPDTNGWYAINEAVLKWTLPAGVTSVRTLLDNNPTSVPTKVYEEPISTITLSDLSEGESYFHVQFRNDAGWGKVTHYRLAVDTENPTEINISQSAETDMSNPNQVLKVEVIDSTSEVKKFTIKLDNTDAFEYIDDSASGTISLPSLSPGYHSVIIEAFDQAGNSIIGTYSFDILSFDKPIFTDYPNEMNEEVIPVIKGTTKPRSTVEITLHKIGGEPNIYKVTSNDAGEFIFIPEGTLSLGVYELSAIATDEFGAISEVSDSIRIAVQQPGYLRIGSLLISVLSVFIPLLVLLALLIIGIVYLLRYAKIFRRQVRTESVEALDILSKEFTSLRKILQSQEQVMRSERKSNKLTKAEADVIELLDSALLSSQTRVAKEIKDVTDLTKRKQ